MIPSPIKPTFSAIFATFLNLSLRVRRVHAPFERGR
jgi:hypothetical protein